MPPKKFPLPKNQTILNFTSTNSKIHTVDNGLLSQTVLNFTSTNLKIHTVDDIPLNPNPPKRQRPAAPGKENDPETDNQRFTLISESDAVADYQLSLLYLCPERIDWKKLSPGDQQLQKDFEGLAAGQVKIYHSLVSFLRTYVADSFGSEHFNQEDCRFVWNWPTWHRSIIKVVRNSDKDTDGNDNNCWFSTFSCVSDTDRPKIHIAPGTIQLSYDNSSLSVPKNRRLKFTSSLVSEAGFKSSVARMVAVLLHGPPADKNIQASHLCHNVPQICFNPRHVIWESDKKNKGRGYCVHGARFYCPHDPKCIYTNLDGVFLPHRNLDTFVACDCPGFDCHKVEAEISVKLIEGDK